LNLYNYLEHKLPYSGTIKAVIYQDKGLIFFSPISRTIHVSALEQTEMLEKVEYEAVRKTCQMITATVHSELARTGANTDKENGTAKAINEVLTTPSIEAPDIAKSTIIADTTAKSTKTDTPTADAEGKSSADTKQ
jgi:hypothetical protein